MRRALPILFIATVALAATPAHARHRRHHQTQPLIGQMSIGRVQHGDYEETRRDMAKQLDLLGVHVDWREQDVTSLAGMLSTARQPGLFPARPRLPHP